MMAGTIAGSLFRIEDWLPVACAISLFALSRVPANQFGARQRMVPLGLVGAMLVCTLVGYFGLQPFMAELRAAARAV
ncbi:MAG: putative rane protein [Burkholderia sp.]|jgi:hypothetical protein|nr:putative rane protein [Burkholderia sp.]